MDDNFISINAGDAFTVTKDTDGYPAIKIQNTVWVEEPRWILAGSPDPDQVWRLDELIDALTALRASMESELRR